MARRLTHAEAAQAMHNLADRIGSVARYRDALDDVATAPEAQARHSAVLTTSQKRSRMDVLRAEIGDCQRCELCVHRAAPRDDGKPSQIVFGEGDLDAEIFIVGEAPGDAEDRTGRPFVDDDNQPRAGAMLSRMLENVVGVPRSRVYVTNVVKCRPPNNRDPDLTERESCEPFWRRQLAIVQPRLVMAVGRVSAQSLLRAEEGIQKLRGRWGDIDGVPVMPILHPSFLMRQREQRRRELRIRSPRKVVTTTHDRYTRSDLIAVKEKLSELRAAERNQRG